MSDVRLGRDTGSLVNYVSAQNDENAAINVGDGATLLSWSDRHPATVLYVSDKDGKARKIVIQQDKATRTDSNGMSESQDYDFSRNPDGAVDIVTFRKSAWRTEGGTLVAFGYRDRYYDFSF